MGHGRRCDARGQDRRHRRARWPAAAPCDCPTGTQRSAAQPAAAVGSAAVASGALALVGSGFNAQSTVVYEYDGLNRISRAIYGDGTVVEYQYDAAGNLLRTAVTKSQPPQ